VVGTAQTSAGIAHAFVYKGGVMTDLHSLLSGQSSSAAGINNSEHVAGTWRGTDSVNQAFLLADGVRIALGTLGGMESFPSAVNNTDQVVGSSDLASGVDHAFLYTRANGEMADLGTLGGTFSYASDISDTGFVTGYAALNNDAGTRAFLYKSSTGMVNLGTLPGGGQSRGSGVNDAGQVVGFAVASDFSLKAFVYTDGQLRDLNTLIDAAQPLPQGIELTDALGINNQGWIVAEGYNASTDQTTPYLLIPVVNSADSD
jgi:probable HAF family extracellular repeat protein